MVTLMIVALSLKNTDSGLAYQSSGHVIYLPIVSSALVPTVFGVENTDFSTRSSVGMIIQAGTTWARYNNLLWSDLQPLETKPPDWKLLDPLKQLLSINKNKQVNVILVIRNTPDWAQLYPGSTCGPMMQDKFPAFAQFLHDLVLQLSVPPYNVKYWEVDNEPDAQVRYANFDLPFGCWGEPGQPYYGGSYYGQMLQQVYPAIKSADPTAKVLIGGLLLDCDPDHPIYEGDQLKDCSSSRFLEGILASNDGHGGDYFDVVSYHAYDYYNDLGDYSNFNWNASSFSTGPSSTLKDQFVRSVLEKYGYTDKLFINTETALLCNRSDCAITDGIVRNNYENTKAYYVAVDFASAIVNKLTSRIWFDIDGVWRYSGLLYMKNPRPSYYAFKTAAAELGYAKYVKDVTQFPGIKGYQFTRDNRVIWFLWSGDGRSHTLHLPRVPVLAYDSLGNTLTPSQVMMVGINPNYLEWVGNP
jgi:hypothetical protein